MQPYVPSNRVPVIGYLALVIAALAGGLAVGALTYFVSRQFYLVILFPLIIGALAGACIYGGVQLGRVRSPLIAMLFGVLAALATYGTYHYLTYAIGFYGDLQDEFKAQFDLELSDEDAQELGDTILQEETGATGIFAYMELTARDGITFSDAGRPTTQTDPTIKGVAVWIYWGIELLLIAGVAAGIGRLRAREPYSESGQKWFTHSTVVGLLDGNAVPDFIRLLETNQAAPAAALLHPRPKKAKGPRVEVVVRRVTGNLGEEAALVVHQIIIGRQGSESKKRLVAGIIPIQTADVLEAHAPAAQP